MTHSLTLGSLLLIDDLPNADHGYALHVLAEGMTFGVAQGVREVVRSLLADGDLERITRYGNRQVTFLVEIEGPSLDALAQGEAALRREVGKPNTLTWQAPDIFAAASVFPVITSEMSQVFNDLDELKRRRTFEVTLTCAPRVRSVDMVTVEAIESGTTSVLIDDCASATGWTGTRNGVATVAEGPSTIWEAGAVGVLELSDTVGFPPETWTLTRTGAVDFSTTPFLDVEITTLSAKAGAPLGVSAHINGGGPLPVLQARLLTDGSQYFRVTFDTGGVAASSITFKHVSAAGYGHAWQGLSVRNIARTDIAPGVTARQQTRIIETIGTERTPATIHVADPDGSEELGLTIVHTSPEDGSGYSPPLRRWRVSGNTVDTPRLDAMSGSVEPLNPDGVKFRIPTRSLPMGGYLLVARLATTDPGTVPIYWSVGTVVSEGGEQQEVSVNRTIWDSTAPSMEGKLVSLGVVTLPTIRTQTGYVEVGIQRDPASTMHVVYDEVWLFREGDDCALTMVDANWPNLWLESPDVTTPEPTVLLGPSREVRWHPGAHLKAMGTHVLHEDGTAVFTATDKVDHPRTSATYYPLWSNNAGQ